MAASEPLYVLEVQAGRAAGSSSARGPSSSGARCRVAPGRLLAPALRVQAKLRYRTDPVWATVRPGGDGFTLDLDEPVSGVAPGQTAVLYDDDAVVGAGVICVLTAG